ncbi:hypothetical protein [Nocardioides sp.]|uniref:hypothetical protein n=1 Tax=Nocardioides sp. TaxID=35761 RepID=UPI0039E24C76
MAAEEWRGTAVAQAGVITRAQLAAAGVDRWAVAHRVRSERWQLVSSLVVATFTGTLTRDQLMWAGVLHGGPGAMVGGLTAAELAGLRNWRRDVVTILLPYGNGRPSPVEGVEFVRTRRTATLRDAERQPPRCRLEPAVLLAAARGPSERAARGVLAAVVQQQLTTPEALAGWLDKLAPLRRAPLLRVTLADISGGAQSVAEIDVARMCRTYGLALPTRQVKRRDSTGRWRFTDCEWRLPDGRTLVLEVDGGFHMDAESWEEDIARQRALTSPDRLVVRCTSRELRDEQDSVARDLAMLGVPRAA